MHSVSYKFRNTRHRHRCVGPWRGWPPSKAVRGTTMEIDEQRTKRISILAAVAMILLVVIQLLAMWDYLTTDLR